VVEKVGADESVDGEAELAEEVTVDMLLDFRTRRRRCGSAVRGCRLERVVKRFSSRDSSVIVGLGMCGGRLVYEFVEAIRVVRDGKRWVRRMSWGLLV
jgi:hypothetical protein